MQTDPFTGHPTRIVGRQLLAGGEKAALQDDHRRRLETLARLGAAAARVGFGTDPDDDLVLSAEDGLSLLESTDTVWGELAAAVREWRAFLPFVTLETFGFPTAEESDDPMGEGSPRLRRIGSGVEASAYMADDGSIYKFYLPREEGCIGGSFQFTRGDETALLAEASLGSYRDLFEKLFLINALDGMPTEVIGVTPEGVVVAKQTLGDRLAEGTEVTPLLSATLIPIPSRFLRAHRDHPRLTFVGGEAWFVADTHEKNLVVAIDGSVRVIDLLAAPWPQKLSATEPLMTDWLARASIDPAAGLLAAVSDDEL